MVTFRYDVEGEKQLDAALSRTRGRTGDLRGFFTMVGRQLREATMAQFESQGGRSGAWQPLSDRYATDKLRRFGPKPIMEATGRLRRSLEAGGGENILETTADSLAFGTRVPYAGFHQRGTSVMPQRRLIQLTKDDQRSIMKLLQRHVFSKGFGL